MKRFKGVFFLKPPYEEAEFDYQVVNDIIHYDSNYSCIIVKALYYDLSLFLDGLSLIITEKGSRVSHITLMARERNIPIIKIPKIINMIPSLGRLIIKNEEIEFK